jgi:uncharacterized protein (UPF0332 family)
MKGSERADLIEYRLNRATETLSEIEIHVNNGLWNTAINRLYYACYYAASALLLANDIKTSTHSGVRQMLGLHFVKTGKISSELGKVFSDLFDKRHSSDYDDFISVSREDVEDLLPSAKEFIEKIISLLAE